MSEYWTENTRWGSCEPVLLLLLHVFKETLFNTYSGLVDIELRTHSPAAQPECSLSHTHTSSLWHVLWDLETQESTFWHSAWGHFKQWSHQPKKHRNAGNMSLNRSSKGPLFPAWELKPGAVSPCLTSAGIYIPDNSVSFFSAFLRMTTKTLGELILGFAVTFRA